MTKQELECFQEMSYEIQIYYLIGTIYNFRVKREYDNVTLDCIFKDEEAKELRGVRFNFNGKVVKKTVYSAEHYESEFTGANEKFTIEAGGYLYNEILQKMSKGLHKYLNSNANFEQTEPQNKNTRQ